MNWRGKEGGQWCYSSVRISVVVQELKIGDTSIEKVSNYTSKTDDNSHRKSSSPSLAHSLHITHSFNVCTFAENFRSRKRSPYSFPRFGQLLLPIRGTRSMANPREGRNVSTVIRCAMDPDNACSSAQLCSTPRCQQNLGSLATFGCVVQSRERCPFCCGCAACDARFSNYEKRVLVAARYSEAGSGSSRGTSPSTSSPSTSASLTGTAAAPTSSAIASNPGGGASSTLPSGASEIVAPVDSRRAGFYVRPLACQHGPYGPETGQTSARTCLRRSCRRGRNSHPFWLQLPAVWETGPDGGC